MPHQLAFVRGLARECGGGRQVALSQQRAATYRMSGRT